MNDKELQEMVKSYKHTVLILCGCIVVLITLFLGIVLFVVPDVLARSVEKGVAERRPALLEEVHNTVKDAVAEALEAYEQDI